MSKKMIEDIKKDRRSLREVLPMRKSANIDTPVRARHKEPEIDTDDLSNTKPRRRSSRHSSSPIFSWLVGSIIIMFVVVALGYFVAPIFTKAIVSITPKQITLSINQAFTANRDTTDDDLAFTILPEVEKTATASVPATGSKQIETKASGKIKITNNFSSAPQQLVATTRFATADGKIYRLNSDVTVPGMKGATPGTLEVSVTADKSGSGYNIGIVDFTIPGFSGSPRFGKITARSVTPMSGGMVGTVKAVDQKTEAGVKAQLTEQLKKDLIMAVKAQTPKGFFVSENFMQFSYEVNQLPQNQATDTATFEAKGRANAIIFNENNFTQKLVGELVGPEAAKQSIKITNLETLTITSPTLAKNADLGAIKTLAISVTGKPEFLWQIDSDKIIADLLGKPKNDFAAVFGTYGDTVASAKVIFRPPWSKRFPNDAGRIKIELTTANP